MLLPARLVIGLFIASAALTVSGCVSTPRDKIAPQEYLILHSSPDQAKQLAEAGKKGWKLVSVISTAPNALGDRGTVLYLMRPRQN